MSGIVFIGFAACVSAIHASGSAEVVADDPAGCTITASDCLNFPEFSGMQFRDELGEEHLETGSNEAACLKRAEDFHHWCGNNQSSGSQVAATYNPKRLSQLYHPGACDKGWSQWDAFCYKYFLEMETWPSAEAICRQRDSHLVSIHSQEENRFVAVLQHGLKGWIGYTDINKDTHYEWSDNTQDDFTNFAKNCTGREHEPDCKQEEVQQQWYSSSGTSTSPYTCKRNARLPGLSLLRNTTAGLLVNTSWLVLLPALAVTLQGEVDVVGNNAMPSIKMPEIFEGSSSAARKEIPVARPRLVMPAGSLF